MRISINPKRFCLKNIVLFSYKITGAILLLSMTSASFSMEKADGIRGKRYCEILLANDLSAFAIYTTMGLNDCPSKIWSTITEASIKKQTGATFVKLNGPRYIVIDGFKNTKLMSLEEKKLGGLPVRQAAIVRLTASDLIKQRTPYREHKVDRQTTWIYKAGRPVYELIDPKGQVFVMQSYSVEKEHQTMKTLTTLGSKLKLPKGWQFKTGILQQDEALKAINNQAIVIQDNLYNTYQLATHSYLK